MPSIDRVLTPNHVGGSRDPVNIKIMDVDPFLMRHQATPVTSSLIMEPSTSLFHPEGLYSEDIFGPIGSPERMLRFGYINLNTPIFHPKIFKLIGLLGKLYKEIIAGTAYAVFDETTKNFERVVGDPLDTEGADTGFSFFLRHFPDLQFERKESMRRDDNIDVVEKYRDQALIMRHIVEPAGLRDISNDSSGRLVQDDVNKLYTSLLLYTRSIPKGSQSVLYDTVRFAIQSKVQEIYEYIENFIDGKRGFIQGSFARRNVAMGTRNVITAATNIATDPEDPQLLKSHEVMVGVFQTIKGLQPFTKNAIRAIIADPIFKADTTTQVALSDLKTFELVYTTIPSSERNKWCEDEEVDSLLNDFSNMDLRSKPITVRDVDGKAYALLLIYDDGDEIAICRSVRDLASRWPRPIDKRKLRPMTYIELFYMIAETIAVDKHATLTRYPVIEQGSTYPAKVHVVSTTPARKVVVRNLLSPMDEGFPLNQYPVIGASYMDAMMVHPSKLGGLGGDHDGDKMSCEFIWAKDTNAEIANYLASPASLINTDLRFITGGGNYLVSAMLHNLTYSD